MSVGVKGCLKLFGIAIIHIHGGFFSQKQLVWCHNCLVQKLLRVSGVKVFCCKTSLV